MATLKEVIVHQSKIFETKHVGRFFFYDTKSNRYWHVCKDIRKNKSGRVSEKTKEYMYCLTCGETRPKKFEAFIKLKIKLLP